MKYLSQEKGGKKTLTMCRVLKTLCVCPAFSIKVIPSIRLHVQLFMLVAAAAAAAPAAAFFMERAVYKPYAQASLFLVINTPGTLVQ